MPEETWYSLSIKTNRVSNVKTYKPILKGHEIMAASGKNINPLQRDGVSQKQRYLPALHATQLLDDRTLEELVHFVDGIAAEVAFYDNNDLPSGNWSGLFAELLKLPPAAWEQRDTLQPHVGLFLSFLKLFRHAQDRLNQLPAKHLDFFYKRVLQLLERPAIPDRLHVLFELNKNIEQQLIEKGTLLDAGKDNNGKPLVYALEENVIVNQAQVAQLRSVFNDAGKLHLAPVANSRDGWGEVFDDPDASWPSFGHVKLPPADMGFALAAPLLLLSGGTRKITLTFFLSSNKDLASFYALNKTRFSGISIFASGEKTWLGPVNVQEISLVPSAQQGYECKLQFAFNPNHGPILPYADDVLKEGFNTGSPMIKVLFQGESQAAAATVFSEANLNAVHVAVDVKDMTDVVVESDFGAMDPSKPFTPFGPMPKAGNSFYVGSEEVFTKKFSDVKLKVIWQDLPANLAARYENYPNLKKALNDAGGKFRVKTKIRGKGEWKGSATSDLFPGVTDGAGYFLIPADVNINAAGEVIAKAVLAARYDFRATRYVSGIEGRFAAAPRSVISRAPFAFRGFNLIPIERKAFNEELKEGFMKLTLPLGFGFEEFVQETATVIAYNADVAHQPKKPLPLTPYVPTIQSIRLNYTAETGRVLLDTGAFDSEEAKKEADKKFQQRELQFFHIVPFGHREEHGYIKRYLDFLPSFDAKLLPAFPDAGEFYIGLSQARPQGIVNLLLQLAEGSADAALDPQPIRWSVLCRNHWKPLNSNYLLSDFTNGMLQSGIVRILLPKEATADDNLLDPGFHWLRATIPQFPTSVCNVINVHTQAATAVWLNQGNTDEHLRTALPAGTVKKLDDDMGTIKTVLQPYSSFDGRPQEDSSVFYTRISERLRHKNRTIGLWDYERIVLEQFPEIHKVKCLNHTAPGNELSPGSVTLLLIPQLHNRNAVDILKPRMSAGFLEKVKQFVSSRAALFVNIYVENPDYLEIRVKVLVQFTKGFEPGLYRKKLNDDLIRYLSPWAFESGMDIQFGGSIHKSRVIFFIEQLSYVDFIQDFSFVQNHLDNPDEVMPPNSRTILVSAAQHVVDAVSPL